MIKVSVERVTARVDVDGFEYWAGSHAGVSMRPDTQAFVILGVDTETGEGLDAVLSVGGRVELWGEGRATHSAKLLCRVMKRVRRCRLELIDRQMEEGDA